VSARQGIQTRIVSTVPKKTKNSEDKSTSQRFHSPRGLPVGDYTSNDHMAQDTLLTSSLAIAGLPWVRRVRTPAPSRLRLLFTDRRCGTRSCMTKGWLPLRCGRCYRLIHKATGRRPIRTIGERTLFTAPLSQLSDTEKLARAQALSRGD